MNLAGLPALVVPCGLAKGGTSGLPVGLQMIGPAFREVCFLKLSKDSLSLCLCFWSRETDSWLL